MSERCEDCGRGFDVPSFYEPCQKKHKRPDMADRIVNAIEDDLTDRRGLRQEWESIDDEIRDEIRTEWAEQVRTILDETQS